MIDPDCSTQGDGATARPSCDSSFSQLQALLICDLVGSTALVEALGDRQAAELGHRYDRLTRDLMAHHGGQEIDKSDGFLLLFEHPLQAVCFALDYHGQLDALSQEVERPLTARVGIHFGEVWLRQSSVEDVARGAKLREIEGLAKAATARLMSLARGGQTLLSRGAFDLARRAAVGLDEAADLRWLDHGVWHLHGVADPVDVFEVGREGRAPLKAPAETDKVRRIAMQPRVGGWRPAPGLTVPGRPHWQVERRLGEGGFGEVWLVRHVKTGERRGFKFCFDAARLCGLQREITLFRLLTEELGVRDDINRILDWNLDEAPYFIESEHTRAGSLPEWAEGQGGLATIPLATRLELVAQVATALAAAHSVGVLHKDIKPSNVLIQPASDGVQAQLADFGIGQATERERLAAAGITALGLSEGADDTSSSSNAGTRLYMAPELLEGRPPTLQADIYALGVMLYQVVVGDLGRALASGWRRDIDDELLAEDIACFVDRSPERRPSSAREVAERLRSLDERRRQHEAASTARRAFERSQSRRKIYKAVAATSLVALVVVSILALWAVRSGREEKRARQATEKVLSFMVSIFEITDPFGTTDPGEERGETITAREILDRGTERVEREFADQPLVRARLMDTFGSIYKSLGLYDKARLLLEHSFETRWRLLGGEHPDTLRTMGNLAVCLDSLGEYVESRRLNERTLEIEKRVLGAEHPETLRTMNNLAASLYSLGQYAEARWLYERTVEIKERVLGVEHPSTLASIGNLALSLYSLGDYTQAQVLYKRTLEIEERVLGSEHPQTLNAMGNLALSLDSLGEYAQARQLYERTLEIQERVLGGEHPYTLVTKSDLAPTLATLGDFPQAIQILEGALEVQKRQLGVEHRDTLRSMYYLAVTLRDLGNFEQAEILQEHTLEIIERSLGAKNLNTLGSMNNLGRVYWLRGDYARARMLQERALEIHGRVFSGLDHPETLDLMNNLAGTLWKTGEVEKAKELAKTAFEKLGAKLGAEHPYTTRAAKRLLEIAVDENDSVAIARWAEKLRWLAERDEDSIAAAEQRETRRYLLEVMAK